MGQAGRDTEKCSEDPGCSESCLAGWGAHSRLGSSGPTKLFVVEFKTPVSCLRHLMFTVSPSCD